MSHRASTVPLQSPVGVRATTVTLPRQDGLAWISWLRVAAIAAVVMIHIAGPSGEVYGRGTTVGDLGVLLDFSSRWCVPVFVMISGALLLDPARYRGAGDFLRRRAMRLIPAVIVWHLVYLALVLATTRPTPSVEDLVGRILTGRLYTALYFFWIVIGLAVITPVLVPWVATVSRRAHLWVGVAAAAVPALTIVTVPIRSDLLWSADMSWVETPWTWWLPYLGYYLLGYALRDVVLTGWRLLLAGCLTVGGTGLLIWHWDRSHGFAGLLERFLPAEAYYSPTVVVIAVCVFLCARALIRPRGALQVLCGRGLSHAGRKLGDSTLGVFVVHLLVLQFVLNLPFIGGDRAAASVPQLLARYVAVFFGAYLLSLLGNRLPVLRRLF